MRDRDGGDHDGQYAPGTGTVPRQASELGVGKRTLVNVAFQPSMPSVGPVQLQALLPHRAQGEVDVHATAAHGLEGPADSLPHLGTIQRLFGRHDVGGVRAHVGGPAMEASSAMGAEAYATGDHVAFAGAPSLHTAAHEAAHVVQQRGGVQLKGDIGADGDPYEQHADAVADRVVAGRSAEDLLDGYAPGSNSAAASTVQRKPAGASAAASGPAANGSAPQAGGDHAAQLILLLTSTSPGPGGDPLVAYLERFDTPTLLAALTDAVDCGYAPRLHARLASARPLLVAALYAAELTRIAPIAPNQPLLHRAGAALDLISRDQQVQILSFLLHRRGVSIEATALVEGVLAVRAGGDQDAAAASQEQLPAGAGRGAADAAGAPTDEHAAGAAIGASVAGAMPAPISPDPWAPPGKQPGELYVGTEAHNAIARVYEAAHPTEQVATNSVPLSSILEALSAAAKGTKPNTTALEKSELARRPDIANLTRHHLYEIKPATAQAVAAARARMYLSLFERAGVAMTLGPTTEPGTMGGLPAPAGVFLFESPEPGVITYQYRRGRLVPVPVAQPEPATERRWRWELQPLTPQQRQAIVTTTVGGAILILFMVILAPVGA